MSAARDGRCEWLTWTEKETIDHAGRNIGRTGTISLLWNLAGWVHDFQRIQRLEAEPTPPYKVITKNEAWQRIYTRATQFIPR